MRGVYIAAEWSAETPRSLSPARGGGGPRSVLFGVSGVSASGVEPRGFLLGGTLAQDPGLCPGARTPPGCPRGRVPFRSEDPRPLSRPDSLPALRGVWAHPPRWSCSDHAQDPSHWRPRRWPTLAAPCYPGGSSARLSGPDPQLQWGRFSGAPAPFMGRIRLPVKALPTRASHLPSLGLLAQTHQPLCPGL